MTGRSRPASSPAGLILGATIRTLLFRRRAGLPGDSKAGSCGGAYVAGSELVDDAREAGTVAVEGVCSSSYFGKVGRRAVAAFADGVWVTRLSCGGQEMR
jgi:hypothetical protein